MILGYETRYWPDHVEDELATSDDARAAFARRNSDIPARLTGLAERIGAERRTLDAAILGAARLGRRHGSLGNDFHAYHNEGHVMELAERRLERVIAQLGPAAVPVADAGDLMLFAACHDLRQREPIDVPGPVGGNEAASIAETFRLLDACGFDRRDDRPRYVALELMIAGSTFDSRPQSLPDPATADLPSISGGALARGLALWLDSETPTWRQDLDARRGERLARLAADLDTANVGEPFGLLAETAVRLCREREMRAGRKIDSIASAAPCLGFLGPGQQFYFFDLHRFCSREGEQVFGPQKLANSPRVKEAAIALGARFAANPPANGEEVIAAFLALSAGG